MKPNFVSIRPFLGSKNFQESRRFYSELGFEEVVLFPNMSLFQSPEGIAFYLQDAYVKDWVDNTMVFMEVRDVDFYYSELQKLNLTASFPNSRLLPVKQQPWGKECFLHDPSGILWHFGSFSESIG